MTADFLVDMCCAIHQPNFFPRLSTLAKLYAADRWVVLDDVQFARRDYQHRCRLVPLGEPAACRWLSLSVHLPEGRATSINQARLVESARCRRRAEGMARHFYGSSPYWRQVSDPLQAVFDLIAETDSLTEVAVASTRFLLDQVGWRGKLVRSSDLSARTGRSERLADLTLTVGAGAYLCGSGGLRYIDHAPFIERDLTVVPFRIPASDNGLWRSAARLSSLWALMSLGPEALRTELERSTQAHWLAGSLRQV
jgi:hypothetical protein